MGVALFYKKRAYRLGYSVINATLLKKNLMDLLALYVGKIVVLLFAASLGEPNDNCNHCINYGLKVSVLKNPRLINDEMRLSKSILRCLLCI